MTGTGLFPAMTASFQSGEAPVDESSWPECHPAEPCHSSRHWHLSRPNLSPSWRPWCQWDCWSVCQSQRLASQSQGRCSKPWLVGRWQRPRSRWQGEYWGVPTSIKVTWARLRSQCSGSHQNWKDRGEGSVSSKATFGWREIHMWRYSVIVFAKVLFLGSSLKVLKDVSFLIWKASSDRTVWWAV